MSCMGQFCGLDRHARVSGSDDTDQMAEGSSGKKIKNSTRGLTVLTAGAILQLEQRKRNKRNR